MPPKTSGKQLKGR
ncbi:unnamed protein product [Acanthoscelides obtectus]|uniref:Uncharacterized protein n=1 Tax=Acanthoscelides obtectus TaxID=200917 RepID=A0A9P0QIG4_ACAOB|nr:unnamed protein product [Acanthoscelides obtectus]